MHRTGGMMKLRAGLVAHHRPVINKRQGEIQDGRRPRISRAGTEAQCGCERSPHWFRENAGRQLEEAGQPRKYVTEGQVPDEPQRARCPMNHRRSVPDESQRESSDPPRSEEKIRYGTFEEAETGTHRDIVTSRHWEEKARSGRDGSAQFKPV